MPMPLWWGQVNKKIFNPRALKSGDWPVIRHVGRSSGAQYRTPIGAERTESGYVFIVVYGPETDWVQNVLAAGEAVLEVDGDEVHLDNPRLVSLNEAFGKLSDGAKRPPRLLRIDLCLEMDLAQVSEPSR